MFDDKKVVFENDNAFSHKGKRLKTFLQEKHFNSMKWPTKSPDVNTIKNVWSKIKKNYSIAMLQPVRLFYLTLFEKIGSSLMKNGFC